MQPEATTLAYLAGVIDSDGYISITRSVRAGRAYHAPQIGIAGTRPQPHYLASSLWGGRVSPYVPRNPLHRVQYQWSRVGASAVAVIEAIHPYLRVKIEQADLALELWQHLEFGKGDDPYPWFGPDYDPIRDRDFLRSEAINLNQSRNRVGKKAAGRLLDGVEHNGMPRTRGTEAERFGGCAMVDDT